MQTGGLILNEVPSQWLVKPEASFQSEYDVPKFKNIAIDLRS
jgi:hypothetical protein